MLYQDIQNTKRRRGRLARPGPEAPVQVRPMSPRGQAGRGGPAAAVYLCISWIYLDIFGCIYIYIYIHMISIFGNMSVLDHLSHGLLGACWKLGFKIKRFAHAGNFRGAMELHEVEELFEVELGPASKDA